jgi:nitroimidazol reductase NimA-like FMN-containing flavoprotein (pyridoxamine 5'-phosphate oxidase superfamily)
VIPENRLSHAEPRPGALDRNGLEVLSHGQCLELLRTVRLGRIGVSMQALPVVMPVSFALLGDDVVFRSGTGTKLSAAVDRTIVAFEADQVDVEQGIG